MADQSTNGPGSHPLHPYYQRELTQLRKHGRLFRGDHRVEADALGIADDECSDPHVERLIQSFAFLAARIQHRLDDDFPELTNALLNVLYPHYQAPIPSMGIVQFDLVDGEVGLAGGLGIARGTELETGPSGGECRYRTCSPVRLYPLRVVRATLVRRSRTEDSGLPEGTMALLRIELRTLKDKLKFSQLELDNLRFHLDGEIQNVFSLYELLFRDTLAVSLSNVGEKERRRQLPSGCIRAVGFGMDDGVLPYAARSFVGYRLLAEYFAFPRKFCAFDLTGLDKSTREGMGSHVEIMIALSGPRTDAKPSSLDKDNAERFVVDLEKNVDASTFRLGCTPAINLFQKDADPIVLSHRSTEYPLIADERRKATTEIYSVDEVTAEPPRGDPVTIEPFYSPRHTRNASQPRRYWYASRRPSNTADDKVSNGTEISLSFVDLAFDISAPANWTVRTKATCLNRDQPNHLEAGDWEKLALAKGESKVSAARFLRTPTNTLRPPTRHGVRWQLISHLLLNHLSLSESQGDPGALREILQLYDYTGDKRIQDKIEGIVRVATRRTVGRVAASETIEGDVMAGFVRGVEVTLEFDRDRFADNGLFLFATILERFLALYASLNAFTQLRITTRDQDAETEIHRWAPRAGDRHLV